MLDLSIAMKPGKATISEIGNQVLPVVVRLDQAVAFIVSFCIGLMMGQVLFGGGPVILVVALVFGVIAVAAISWEDKGGNSLISRSWLVRRHRANTLHKYVDAATGEKDSVKGNLFYIGCVELKETTHGLVHMQASSVAVAPGSVDKDGVHISKLA